MNPETSGLPNLAVGNTPEQVGFVAAREAFQKNSDWWTVFAAFDLPDFKPSPLWISGKTGIPVAEVVDALEGLSVLGFLRKETGAFYPVKEKDHFTFTYAGKSKQQVIEEHEAVSHQILNDMNPSTTFAIEHCFFAGNREVVAGLYKDIQAAFETAVQRSKQMKQKNDGIYKVTFTAVDVVKRENSNQEGVSR